MDLNPARVCLLVVAAGGQGRVASRIGSGCKEKEVKAKRGPQTARVKKPQVRNGRGGGRER
jgi:hypothetical protein